MRLSAIRSRLRDESGMTLTEVLTSAVLLVIVSLGVTKGIDAASNTSGNAKLRTVAAMLAQEDQERMRSFSSPNLERYENSRVKNVRGVPFTIVSRSTWIADSSGTESCGEEGGDDNEASYMRITSTVTWENMAGARPVVHTSLVAPPNGSFGEQGALLVEIVDRDGEGVGGVPIDADPLSGTGGRRDETTGPSGCAFFGYLPAVNYRISFALGGYVDPQGQPNVVQDVGVTPGATNRASFLYDRAGALAVNVVTQRADGTDAAAQASHITVGHSGLATPGTRIFATGANPSNPTLAGLFPFSSSYGVYSGNCLGADPVAVDAPGQFATVDPGTTAAVTVREVTPRFDGGTNALTDVRLVATGSGCSATTTSSLTGGYMSGDGAVPFGTYEACVRRSNGGSLNRRFRRVTFAADTTAVKAVDLTSTDTSSNPSTGWSATSCGL